MLVIMEAVSGPIAGRRIEVRAGSIVRFGRTTKSDYAIGEDSYLSGVHFSVECDGTQCRVRDMGSSNGTFINGGRITEQIAQEGDSLVAGGSTFTLHFDQSEPVQAETGPRAMTARVSTAPMPLISAAQTRVGGLAPAMTGSGLHWPGFSRPQSILLNGLYGEGETVLVVLDASRDSRIPAFLDASGEPFVALDPTGAAQAFVAAPPPQARLLDVLIKDGWGRGWGYYCTSRAGLDEICLHLRTYLTLYTPLGRPLTFRFWDPRVLRALVPLMSAQEATEFFGPLSRLIVEGERPEMALELSVGPRGPRQQTLVLV